MRCSSRKAPAKIKLYHCEYWSTQPFRPGYFRFRVSLVDTNLPRYFRTRQFVTNLYVKITFSTWIIHCVSWYYKLLNYYQNLYSTDFFHFRHVAHIHNPSIYFGTSVYLTESTWKLSFSRGSWTFVINDLIGFIE